ncbi:hypothetical protein ACO0QE_002309 [Hanseniaspora vineae]
MSTQLVLDAVTARRSIYSLKPELPAGVKLADVESIVQTIIKETPTSFNSQVNRAVILAEDAHKKVWDQVLNSINDEKINQKVQSVKDDAYGTIVFFTDDATTEELQAKFPAWTSSFQSFAQASSGAAQIATWTTLATANVHGTLNHFNGYVKAALGDVVPKNWTIEAQLVFGSKNGEPREKTYIDNKVKLILSL